MHIRTRDVHLILAKGEMKGMLETDILSPLLNFSKELTNNFTCFFSILLKLFTIGELKKLIQQSNQSLDKAFPYALYSINSAPFLSGGWFDLYGVVFSNGNYWFKKKTKEKCPSCHDLEVFTQIRMVQFYIQQNRHTLRIARKLSDRQWAHWIWMSSCAECFSVAFTQLLSFFSRFLKKSSLSLTRQFSLIMLVFHFFGWENTYRKGLVLQFLFLISLAVV